MYKLCFTPSTHHNLWGAFNAGVVSNSLSDGCVPGLVGVAVSEADARVLLATLATAMNVQVSPVIPALTLESEPGTTVQFRDSDGVSRSGTLIKLEGDVATVKLFDRGEITIQVSISG